MDDLSTAIPTPDPVNAAKPQRVLACILCQQRKIKCDRKFPCANCARNGAHCVPAALVPRQRRRRFPERELLERLRHYESLLRQNKINFEPLHMPSTEHTPPGESGRPDLRTDRPAEERAGLKSKPVNLWHAMIKSTLDPSDDGDDDYWSDDLGGSGFLNSDDYVRESVVRKAWDFRYKNEGADNLLFGSLGAITDLTTLHPNQGHIFKLWQIYLENVNPLLKVTHTPTLQPRIIDAISDLATVSPTLEALIFSIYSVSIISLTESECHNLFGSPKKVLLGGYQFGCRQALLNSNVLRSNDCECLTALYLYLVSVRSETDPRSLSSMLGAAIRIARRIGIHNESTYARFTVLETELRRRLWWSLVIFDNRICEMVDYKASTLSPIWDCRTPLNVNDFEIRQEMKTPPTAHKVPTEALFAVVRSELSDSVRHSAVHLDFTKPYLSTAVKNTQQGTTADCTGLDALEKAMEEKYLVLCDADNPLHFMTIWTTRGFIAKNRLLEHYWRRSSSVAQVGSQRVAATYQALRMLECDSKLMASPLTKGYHWILEFHFPFPAYIHILQDLRKWPTEDYAEKAWEVMSDNYKVRVMNANQDEKPLFTVFARVVLQAWEAREAVLQRQSGQLDTPLIVSDIRKKLMDMTANLAQSVNVKPPKDSMSTGMDGISAPIGMQFGGVPEDMAWHGSLGPGPWMDLNMSEQGMGVNVGLLDWATIDWNTMPPLGG
ncbi:hypothetical protein ABW19_dt0200310 [Dactylella cylindrospora]|nr:hypothetical protein ABW19_dt0200310 [Dactylella cylindrospora]